MFYSKVKEEEEEEEGFIGDGNEDQQHNNKLHAWLTDVKATNQGDDNLER